MTLYLNKDGSKPLSGYERQLAQYEDEYRRVKEMPGIISEDLKEATLINLEENIKLIKEKINNDN